MQETGLIFARQVESIPGPQGADIQCLRTEPRVIGRAGRGGEVEQIVDVAEVEWLADVLLYQGESRVIVQLPARLAGRPVEKLSTPTTWWPWARRASHR